ncbi:MAG: hypothetical protein WCT39_03895 [Candidatus Margulisiibacteriota bacterium]
MVQAETNYWGQLTLSKPESKEVSTVTETKEPLQLETNPISLEVSLKQKSDIGFRDRMLASAVCGAISFVFFNLSSPVSQNTGVLWAVCSLYELFKPSQEEQEYRAYSDGEKQYLNYMKKQQRRKEYLSRNDYYNYAKEQQPGKEKGVSFDLKGKSEGGGPINFGIGVLTAYMFISYQDSFLKTMPAKGSYYMLQVWMDGILSFVIGTTAFSEIGEAIENQLEKVSSK